jgi:hypothetical protein
LKIKNWTSRIQDRSKWKLYVERGKTFRDWSCSAWRRRREEEEDYLILLKICLLQGTGESWYGPR